MKLTICLQGQEPVKREYEDSVLIRDIADEMQKTHPYRIVLARIDGHVQPLSRTLTYGSKLELLDIRDPGALIGIISVTAQNKANNIGAFRPAKVNPIL